MVRSARGFPASLEASVIWTPAVGLPCSFYHEGGHGASYWAVGWRYGIIRAIPSKGRFKGYIQIEIPVDLYGWNDGKLKDKPRGWYLRERQRAWVHRFNVNAVGDSVYHGPSVREMVAERRETKAKQEKADEPPAAGYQAGWL